MKSLMFLLCFAICNSVFAQGLLNDNEQLRIPTRIFYVSNATTVSGDKYAKLTSGSPYFSSTWMKGTVFLDDHRMASDVRMRLDLVDGSLIYKNDKNEDMISALPVVQVAMIDTTTGKQYIFIASSSIKGIPGKTWYQVLAGKTMMLVKDFHKKIIEKKSYGSSITEQEVHASETYAVLMNNSITKVKKMSDITSLAGSKSAILQQYIDQHDLSVKREADLIAVVEYYYSLN